MDKQQDLIDVADDQMRAGDHEQALKTYQSGWEQRAGAMHNVERVWLLLSIANAAVRAGDFEEAFGALSALVEHYSDTGIVVGNPLFHLLVGASYHGLDENPEGETDNFARALICGGPAIFTDEDPAHLERMKSILKPPAETGTWEGYTGCSRDTLDDAPGYLRELLIARLGQAPPYTYPS